MNTNRRIDFKDLRDRTKGQFRTVLVHYGLSPVGQGDQARIRCPFHDDEHPSCSVNLAEGLWNCHAGCGSGNLLEFVHRMETRDGATVSIRQAGLKLASICGVTLNGAQTRQEGRTGAPAKETAGTSSQGSNARPGSPQRGSEASPVANRPLAFALTLDLDAALAYLAGRGITRDVAAEFGLGLCTHGKTIPGRLGIPIHNAGGELVAYAGRWVGPDEAIPESEGKYKLAAGFHKNLELFNLQRVRDCQTLVVVEGYFGAIRLFGGLRVPTVALMGSSISEAQIALLLEHCPALRFVTVCLDPDDAGRKAVETVAARLAQHWWVRVATLPDGTQPDTVPEDALLTALGRKRYAAAAA